MLTSYMIKGNKRIANKVIEDMCVKRLQTDETLFVDIIS